MSERLEGTQVLVGTMICSPCLASFECVKIVVAGEHPLPSVRIEEMVCVLQELAQLVIHSDTASVLHLPSHLKQALEKNENFWRAHLLVLFPTFCELVISRFVHFIPPALSPHFNIFFP